MYVDKLIDDVAREITAAEPPADLSARVAAQIEAVSRREWVWRLAPLGALAGLAAVALLVVRAVPPATPGLDRSPAPPPAVALSTQHAAPSTVSALPVSSTPPAGRRGGVRKAPAASPAEVAWRARALPALAKSAPIEIEPIQPLALGISLMEVEAIGGKPLSIVPIGSGTRH